MQYLKKNLKAVIFVAAIVVELLAQLFKHI